jgi:PAS domain S-box-containing protein
MRIVGWSPAAEELLGHRPSEVLGRPIDAVLADSVTGAGIPSADGGPGTPESVGPTGIRSVRHRDGHSVPVALTIDPLAHGTGGAAWLVVAMGMELLRQRAIDRAVLDGLYRQSPVELVVYDTDARVRWINTAIEKQFGLTLQDVEGRLVRDILPEGVLLTEDGRAVMDVEQAVLQVVRTGEPVVDVRYRSPTRRDPHHERVWSLSYFLLRDDTGRPVGVCEAGLDITDRYVTRQRLSLLSRASGTIGRTLDMRRTADDLVRLAVPEFADAAVVDLLEPVLRGEEPPLTSGRSGPADLRRVARHAHGEVSDTVMYAPGALDDVRLRCLAGAAAADPAIGALAIPLTARGAVLGSAVFVRIAPRDPFDAEEIALAGELVSRTAVCLDNADGTPGST